MDDPWSVSISGLWSLSCWLSWTYASSLTNWALGKGECEYTYLGGKLSIWERLAPSCSPCGPGGVPGRGGVSSGVGWLGGLDGGAPVPLHLQCSVSNGSTFGPGRFYRSVWQQPYPIENGPFFKRTITLRPQVLIRKSSVWWVEYVAPHGASFGDLRFLISSNFSKW